MLCQLWQRMKKTSFKMFIKMEWEVLKGAFSGTATQDTAGSNRKHTLPDISPQEDTYYTTPAGSREIFYLPSNRPSHWESVMNQPMENHYTSIPGFLQWTFCLLTAPPNSCLFLYNITYLSFVISKTCLWFAIAWVSQISIPLPFPNKLILAGKITGYFLKLTILTIQNIHLHF